jgi:phosphatidylserine/phosphatidylglycerophosphate/cardiolipin synthase-like enzyme
MTARGRARNFAAHRQSGHLQGGHLKRLTAAFRWRRPALATLVAALAFAAVAPIANAFAAQIEVCFSPPLPGGCDPIRAIEDVVRTARRSILIQAYEITPGPLVTALVEAHRRGVDVRAIVDYKQLTDRRNRDDAFAVEHLGAAGIPVLVDRPPGLMHDKVMIIDGEVVVTGSFNYTYSAEHRNVENLLVIRDPRWPRNTCSIGKAARSSPGRFASAQERRSIPRRETQGKWIARRRRPRTTGRSSVTGTAASTSGPDALPTTRSRPPIASSF